MKRILILWSGGCDSTAILKMYLEKTDYEIIALRVNYKLINNKPRQKLEQKSINLLLPELKKIRDFQYLEIDVDYPTTDIFKDTVFIGMLSFNIALNNKCTEIILGWTSDVVDTNIRHVNRICNKLNTMIKTYFDANSNYRIWKESSIFVIPEFFDTKSTYIKELGDLFQYTWSCRAPVNDLPCGRCATCLHIKKSK